MKKVYYILILLSGFYIAAASEPWSPALRKKIDSLNVIIAKTSDKDTTKVSCYLEQVALLYLNSPDTALQISKIALKLADQINFYQGAAEANGWLGYLIESKGNADSALVYYQKSFELRQKIGSKNGMAVSLNNIGYIYKSKGNIPLALEYLHRSLKLLEEVNDKPGIAYLLNNMGSIYNTLGEESKALEYYHKSLKLREEAKDEQGIAYSMNNLGLFYKQKGELLKALRYYNNALMIQEKLNTKQGYANSLQNVGELYYLLGDISKAQNYFSNCLGKFEELREKNGISSSLYFLAEIKLKNGQTKEALPLAERSLKIAKEIGYPENIKNAGSVLKMIYSKSGNFKDAFFMQLLCKQMADSISNENNRKLAIQKGFQYAYESKKTADDIKAQAERKMFEAESKQKQLQIILVIIGIILISILSYFIYKRFKITSHQKTLIEKQKLEVNFQREVADKTRLVVEEQKQVLEEKQKEILDSIHYAKRIQQVILADQEFISNELHSDFFIYYMPKDIVSGDFYWATKKNDKFYIAICDSTGHGVPGSFMSLLNIGFLSEAIDQLGIEKPNDVLNYVRKRLIENISKEGQKDGFDGILLCVDNKTRKITYAAAHNSPLLIQNEDIIHQACDHMPVGIGEKTEEFNLYTIDHKKGSRIYLYTDGYADQFGGPKGKKFKYKQLEEVLLKIHHLPMEDQKEKLKQSFENWRGELEQIDDVLVMGIEL